MLGYFLNNLLAFGGIMSKRRKHPASVKLEVALAAIKGDLSQSQLTSKYQIHTTQISTWKKQAMEGMKAAFKDNKTVYGSDDHQQLQAKLYEQIGRLQMELDWLKKKSQFDGC